MPDWSAILVGHSYGGTRVLRACAEFPERIAHAIEMAVRMCSADSRSNRIVKQLEQQNLLDNTIIIFTSDNGGLSTAEGRPTSNLPFRGGKGWAYEGGVRVPICRQPASGSSSMDL